MLRGLASSLGFDRDTVRKYVRMAQKVGIDRGKPFPESEEVASKLKGFMDSAPQRPTPAKSLIAPHREWIDSLLPESQMTAKQVWKLFREKTGLAVGYCTMKRYLAVAVSVGERPR